MSKNLPFRQFWKKIYSSKGHPLEFSGVNEVWELKGFNSMGQNVWWSIPLGDRMGKQGQLYDIPIKGIGSSLLLQAGKDKFIYLPVKTIS